MMTSAHSNDNWIVIMESSIPARVKRFVFVPLTWILHLSFGVYHDVYYQLRLFPGLSTQWQLCSPPQECIARLFCPGITYWIMCWMWKGIPSWFYDTQILQRFVLWLQTTMDLNILWGYERESRWWVQSIQHYIYVFRSHSISTIYNERIQNETVLLETTFSFSYWRNQPSYSTFLTVDSQRRHITPLLVWTLLSLSHLETISIPISDTGSKESLATPKTVPIRPMPPKVPILRFRWRKQ